MSTTFDTQPNKNTFHDPHLNSLGDYVRRNNSAWRSHNYAQQQRDPVWHQYLRRQADLPAQTGIPYGKRRKPNHQVLMYNNNDNDDDLGVTQMNLNSPPTTLTWLYLQAIAPPKDKGIKRSITKALCPSKEVGESKVLLKGVSGIAKPGQLVAIMGASGAGKTTLMNILTSRRPGTLEIEGEVRVNGTNMGRHINRVAGYVQQEEFFIPSLTARQHLRFQAMLRLPRHLNTEQREKRVEQMLEALNLQKVQNTIIGQPGRIKGLSGGEKRRLLFASEILCDPSLLFADEPTSGLDGSMAFIICDIMRKLCNQGKTIVCTIHQPSSEIFELFDTLYLLAEGRVAYFGSREKAQDFFSSMSFEAPVNYNLADFYIQTLAIVSHDRENSLARVESICDQYEQSRIYARYVAEAEQYHEIDDDQSKSTHGLFKKSSKFKASFWTQLRWLLWRSSIDTFRNPIKFRFSVFIAIIGGIIYGLLFLRLEYNQKAFQNLSAIIIMLIIDAGFSQVQKNADAYSRELPLFIKEHDDGIYRTIPYYVSKMCLEMPTTAFTTFLIGTIVYWMSNLYSSAQRYFILQGILILCAMVSLSIGAFIGIVVANPDIAGALIVPVVLPLLVFAGFFVNTESIRDWLIWIKYISWLYYSNEMAIINQWRDVTYLECDQPANMTCFSNGLQIITYYGFDIDHYYRNLGILFALFGGFRIAALIALALRARFQRQVG